jgi:hypothetical protein
MIELSPSHVSVGKYIDASPSEIWSLLTDTDRWPDWGPTVMKVESVDRFIELGSKGRVKTALGIWLPFKVTAFEESRYWNWKVASIKATGHRLTANPEGDCALWFDTPLFAAPYILACQLALGRIEKMLSAG